MTCGYQTYLLTCSNASANWLLMANGAGQWTMGFSDRVGGSIPTYVLPDGATFNCLGPNTFNALGDAPSFSCRSFPGAVTISPAP